MPIALISDNDNHRLTRPPQQFHIYTIQILIECFSDSLAIWAYCVFDRSVKRAREHLNKIQLYDGGRIYERASERTND